MGYQDFLEMLKAHVAEQSDGTLRVRIASIIKNNRQPLDSLVLLGPGENTAPAIYLEPYYKDYLSGTPLGTVAQQILDFYQEHRAKGALDLSFFTEYARAKPQLACRIVNYEKNQSLLASVPHRRFLDLALIYYCRIDHPAFGRAGITIQQTHLEMWGISESELHETACTNTCSQVPYELLDIVQMMREVTGILLDESYMRELPMYVLTNTEKSYGAAMIFFPAVLEKVAATLGEDYYVLPSSIHECMILPLSSAHDMTVSDLEHMVCEINEKHVAYDEVLSNSVYRYSCSGKVLGIAGR